MSDFLTVAEFAAATRTSIPTVYREIKKGRIPVLQIGTVKRIPRSALQIKA